MTLIHHPIPGKPIHPHPARVAIAASPTCRQMRLTCETCGDEWMVPCDPWGEPDVKICGTEILSCPGCGTTTLYYPANANASKSADSENGD